jgi:Flp pilus assembly protein TadD
MAREEKVRRGIVAGGVVAVAAAGIAAAVFLRAGGFREKPPVESAVAPARAPAAPVPRPESSPASLSGATAATHVGRAVCAECHPAELAAWSGSDHDRAMEVADERSVLGDFSGATFEHFGVATTFSRRDGKYWVRTDGPDGKLHDYEIAYTFGFRPLQQYLIAFPGGRYQALGIAWDSRPAAEGGQRWFHLYPDEAVPAGDVLHWTGFAQNWNGRCAECHSTDLERGYVVAEDRYETTWAEIDVSCEACHGPGSAHVAWARDADGDRAGDPSKGLAIDLSDGSGVWVMDPTTGIARRSEPRSSQAEIETCARCHSRRGVVSEDYHHGQPLMDTHRPALLEEGLYFPDGQIEDEVYEWGSFLQSRMYRAGVTCTSCHDPHTLRLRGNDGPDSVCAQCHLPARFAAREHHHHTPGSPGSSCVACHMPARTYMGVDVRRDHSLRIPRPDLTVAIGTPNPCNACHSEQAPSWAAESLAEWYGPARTPVESSAAVAIAAGRRGDPGSQSKLIRLAGDASQPAIVRATAVSLLWQSPTPEIRSTIASALVDPDPLVRSAAVLGTQALEPAARLPLAAPLLRDPVRTVRIDAARALAALAPAQVPPGERAALEAGLAEYVRAQLLNTDGPEGHLNLGILAAERGDLDSAERAYRTAILRAPSLPQAYVNLADLHRAWGHDDEAERALRAGIERSPEDPSLHHALGLTLVREKRLPEAIASLQRAAELAPDRARYAYVFAVALDGAGERAQGLEVLRQAHARHPGDRDVLTALATISRDAGDRRAAAGYARALVALSPSDPAARRLLAELEGESP